MKWIYYFNKQTKNEYSEAHMNTYMLGVYQYQVLYCTMWNMNQPILINLYINWTKLLNIVLDECWVYSSNRQKGYSLNFCTLKDKCGKWSGWSNWKMQTWVSRGTCGDGLRFRRPVSKIKWRCLHKETWHLADILILIV